ncbi:hypothetical protein SDC9_152137 [bioreactor metagenome]|uniref:Uncharacterized protein n=1 Tax=bioreactor metagenome TaxID=1076179 RepID=A0A645EUL7_9ZZZZ
MPLGLKYLVLLDGAELADGAVHGRYRLGRGNRASPLAQFAREEVVERGVARDVRVCSLGHVDLVMGHKAPNHGGCQAAALHRGQSPHVSGQRPLGQQVLWENGKSV